MNTSVSPSETAAWNIGRALNWMSERFGEMSESPRLDAQLLLSHVLECSRVTLYTQIDKPLTLAEREALRVCVRRRLAGEPVAYILGTKHWHDMELAVDRRVLIPRPETETLFDLVSRWAAPSLDAEADRGRTAVIIDLCTGSGCLALAFARRFPRARVFGMDISHEALEVARANGTRYAADNVTWCEPVDVTRADGALPELRRALAEGAGGQEVSVVLVANPPYVTSYEWQRLSLDVRDFEPRLALEAGDDGLRVARGVMTLWEEISRTVRKVRPESCVSAFFGMELAEGQPKRLMQEFGAQSAVSGGGADALQPSVDWLEGAAGPVVNGYCALPDLAGRMRYLFGHVGSADLPPAEHGLSQDV